MSIGKVVENVTLVKQNSPASIKTIKVSKGILNRSTNSFTLTEWGDNIWDWAVQHIGEIWTIGGMSEACILIGGDASNGYLDFYLGRSDVRPTYYDSICRVVKEQLPNVSYNPTSMRGGWGAFLFYDGTTNPDKGTYFIIGAPVYRAGDACIMTQPVPYVNRWSTSSGWQSSEGYWNGYIQNRPYNDWIFENYDIGDYDPQKANPTTIWGFPYAPDNSGESTSHGGGGSMTDSSEPIEIDDARLLFVGNLFRLYKITVTDLSNLSNFLLDPSFLSSVSKLFNDPMDYLTSLVAIPYSGFAGYNETITVGAVPSTVTGSRITNFFHDLDCGSINFEEYFQTFMDYSPYTRVTLYLPMIGYVPVNVDEFQNDRISIKYRLDALTGQCVAFISNSRGLVGMYNGNCAYHIPLRSRDYSNMISGIINSAATSGRGGVESMIYNTALNGAMNFKPAGSVTTAGTFSGNCGVLTNKKPYLIIERPYISLPSKYGHNIGYRSQITSKLSSLHGFTKVEAIHLDHVIATREEKAELEVLLKNGVVLP